MNKTSFSDVLAILENNRVPIYKTGVNRQREVIGYAVAYTFNGFSVKLRGNPNTKKYQKILNEWGEVVRNALSQAFEGQVTSFSLKEFFVKEEKQK